jgi:hypothetical protein
MPKPCTIRLAGNAKGAEVTSPGICLTIRDAARVDLMTGYFGMPTGPAISENPASAARGRRSIRSNHEAAPP